MSIPDPIERMEMNIERMIDQLNVTADEFTCPNCKKRENLNHAVALNSNPDAMPVCEQCANEWFHQKYGKRIGDF